MQLAMDQAIAAQAKGEVPIGAVIVKDGQVIGSGYNLRETEQNALRHAEIVAIESACRFLKSWRLIDCDLYVTLEPCLMCAGAIYQARINRLVFAAFDPKAGAVGSLYNIHEDKRLNHNFAVLSGVREQEASKLLKDFFRLKRTKQ
jgi:tRNA(adenine34) deaminase